MTKISTFPVPELLVVMPAYNEEEAIGTVVKSWHKSLVSSGVDFLMLVIDDGSTDSTPLKLEQLSLELDRIDWVRQENRGHGQTCLKGYLRAVERGIPHVLQIDTDGQCDPAKFRDFWSVREHYDAVYGKRTRADGWKRRLASLVLRKLIHLVSGVDCPDANVPYRLMRTSVCQDCFDMVPPDFDLANVGLSVLLRRRPEIRHGYIPIHFPERIGGEPSVPFTRFGLKAMELARQLKRLTNQDRRR